MKNKEILKKAIEKAIESGYILDTHGMWIYSSLISNINSPADRQFSDSIIFSHKFAKAFWGEKIDSCLNLAGFYAGDTLEWQFHLQNMVLEEEPLKYIESFL